jgi:hypothetical protein
MTTLVEEMMAAIYQFDICEPDERAAQAALDCVTKHLFQMSQIVDTEYRGYLKAVIAHLDQERIRARLTLIKD